MSAALPLRLELEGLAVGGESLGQVAGRRVREAHVVEDERLAGPVPHLARDLQGLLLGGESASDLALLLVDRREVRERDGLAPLVSRLPAVVEGELQVLEGLLDPRAVAVGHAQDRVDRAEGFRVVLEALAVEGGLERPDRVVVAPGLPEDAGQLDLGRSVAGRELEHAPIGGDRLRLIAEVAPGDGQAVLHVGVLRVERGQLLVAPGRGLEVLLDGGGDRVDLVALAEGQRRAVGEGARAVDRGLGLALLARVLVGLGEAGPRHGEGRVLLRRLLELRDGGLHGALAELRDPLLVGAESVHRRGRDLGERPVALHLVVGEVHLPLHLARDAVDEREHVPPLSLGLQGDGHSGAGPSQREVEAQLAARLDELAVEDRLGRGPLRHRVQGRLVEPRAVGGAEVAEDAEDPLAGDRAHVAGLREVGDEHLGEALAHPLEVLRAGGVGEGQDGQGADGAGGGGRRRRHGLRPQGQPPRRPRRGRGQEGGGDDEAVPPPRRPPPAQGEGPGGGRLPLDVREHLARAGVAQDGVDLQAPPDDALQVARDVGVDLPHRPRAVREAHHHLGDRGLGLVGQLPGQHLEEDDAEREDVGRGPRLLAPHLLR